MTPQPVQGDSDEKKIILHLCADTGSDTKPYKDAGYKVIRVGRDVGVENFYPPYNVYGVIANPVCTEFSIARSGGKHGDLEKGMFLVRECQRIISECESNGGLKFWVIENPASGALRRYLGKPDYVYQPWWFGSPWTKKTALWGFFNKPERTFLKWEDVPKISELYVRPIRNSCGIYQMHKSAKKYIHEFDCFDNVENDMEFRSLCSQKFAQAFYECNK